MDLFAINNNNHVNRARNSPRENRTNGVTAVPDCVSMAAPEKGPRAVKGIRVHTGSAESPALMDL